MSKSGIEKRQKQQKALLIEQLEKTPVIQIACEKAGVGRATYYRWVQTDKVFGKSARQALQRGVQVMNDLAESQLLRNIKDGNMTAIIFWLKSRHHAYGNRLEIVDSLEKESLSKEQKELVARVLKKYNK